ncbi:unnamed protein product [Musa acuminata subsp. malaccensis]|uniref:(wild Malaysian banana) hypothetical protein n=1 Tax=Musa acuminata subsp. malaccensis TaxID=214687 RepID=A0A804L7G5_MUSAM|nr:unnamed protein product [Musa acuminata subsp. malaccensis]
MSLVFFYQHCTENMNLLYIPVSFLQTIKSFPPATTVILQWLIWRKVIERGAYGLHWYPLLGEWF